MASKLKYPIVYLEWEDAQCEEMGPWVDNKEFYEYTPLIVHTVAFVLHDSEKGIIITDSFHEGQTGAVHKIPAKMIVKKEYLYEENRVQPQNVSGQTGSNDEYRPVRGNKRKR